MIAYRASVPFAFRSRARPTFARKNSLADNRLSGGISTSTPAANPVVRLSSTGFYWSSLCDYRQFRDKTTDKSIIANGFGDKYVRWSRENHMRIVIVCAVLALCGCSKSVVETADAASFPLVRVKVSDAPFVRAPDSVTIFADTPKHIIQKCH